MNNDVQFDLDADQRVAPRVETPRLVQLVTKYSFGLIRDERQANYALFIFSVIAFSVTIFMILG